MCLLHWLGTFYICCIVGTDTYQYCNNDLTCKICPISLALSCVCNLNYMYLCTCRLYTNLWMWQMNTGTLVVQGLT